MMGDVPSFQAKQWLARPSLLLIPPLINHQYLTRWKCIYFMLSTLYYMWSSIMTFS